MRGNDKHHDPFWDVQVSIANALAKASHPSLTTLHQEILEEIGRSPGLDIIDYFVGISNIPQEAIKKYFALIGSVKKREDVSCDVKSEANEVLIDRIIESGSQTVLQFRKAYTAAFGQVPTEELTALFLQKIQQEKTTIQRDNSQHERQFVNDFVHKPQPTVLKFRTAFHQQYGHFPHEDVTTYFLEKIRCDSFDAEPSLNRSSREEFAEVAAKRGVATVLQFRRAYEKVYGEQPETGIIEAFMRYLQKE